MNVHALEAFDGISRTRRIFAVHHLEVYFSEALVVSLNSRFKCTARRRRRSFTVVDPALLSRAGCVQARLYSSTYDI